jgi:hypothetical protein
MYLEQPIMVAILKYFSKFRLWSSAVGLIIMGLALGLGSFSTSVPHLILTQGVVLCDQPNV